MKNTIERYLQTISRKDAVIEAAFYGGSFTAIPIAAQKELLGAAYPYIAENRIQAIRVSTRPDCISHEILDNLRQYGVSIVELGVQSMDEKVLSLSSRGHTAEDVKAAVKLLQAYGFTVGVQVMTGLPGDTPEKSLATAKALIELNPQIARIYPALVIRNTYLETLYHRSEYQPPSLESAVETAKVLLAAFEKSGVRVIRIGLQPTDNIVPGKDVVAGPFHPAMRQLVESRIYRDMLDYLIEKQPSPKNITVRVNPKSLSDVIGQKKCNLSFLTKKFFIDTFKVCPDNGVEAGTILLIIGEKCISLSRKDYYTSIAI